MMTWDDSIRHFIQQAASFSPTPGGGSVAALVAALGVSMTSMVSNLSQGDKFDHIQLQVAEALENTNRWIAECEALLQADIRSFTIGINLTKDLKGSILPSHAFPFFSN